MLEYASGGTLHDLIHKSNTRLGESETAYYTFQLLRGISHVHCKRFIHCDLKPANILVFPCGNYIADLKLADFGLSLRSAEAHTYMDKSKKLGRYHRHRGTLLYTTPESLVSGIHGRAVDIWAFGCIVVEMLTGRWLWPECKSNDELKFNIAHEMPEIPNNISDDAKDFLGKCLEKDNHLRYTADMLLDHPFIRKSSYKKVMEDRMLMEQYHFGHAGRRIWVSTKHYMRGSCINNISSAEVNNNKEKGRTDQEIYERGTSSMS